MLDCVPVDLGIVDFSGAFPGFVVPRSLIYTLDCIPKGLQLPVCVCVCALECERESWWS